MHSSAGFGVGIIKDSGILSGASLDAHIGPQLSKPLDRVRDYRDPPFVGTAFLRDSNLHCVNTLCFGSTKTAPKRKGTGR